MNVRYSGAHQSGTPVDHLISMAASVLTGPRRLLWFVSLSCLLLCSNQLRSQLSDHYPDYSILQNIGDARERFPYTGMVGGITFGFGAEGVFVLATDEEVAHGVRWHVVGGTAVEPRPELSDCIDRRVLSGTGISCRSGWKSILYNDVLPGVTARWSFGATGAKYEFEVDPGTDPSSVRIAYDGSDGIVKTEEGGIRVLMQTGDLTESPPVAWQKIRGDSIPVSVSFRLENGLVGFNVGTYDARFPLTIDPRLRYSSYLGGNGFDAGRSVTVARSGAIILAGTSTSTVFPTTPGAYRRTRDTINLTRDIFVSSFSPDGSRLVWSTLIVGNGTDDPIAGVRVLDNGNIAVGGITTSTDFVTTTGAVNPVNSGQVDGFVLALNPSGSSLVWSTLVGGTGVDSLMGFGEDAGGNIVVGGYSTSPSLPIPADAYRANPSGGREGFILRLNSNGTGVVQGTWYGGGGEDYVTDLLVERGGETVLTGWTSSNDLPTSANRSSGQRKGGFDGFVARISFDMKGLEYGSYIGGNSNDFPLALGIDRNRRVYLTGRTESNDFPDSVGQNQTGSWFVARFNFTTGNLEYSLKLSPDQASTGLSVNPDTSGRAIAVGYTSSTTFGLNGGARIGPGGGEDVIVSTIASDGMSILRSERIGGTGNDRPGTEAFIAFTGDLYLTGSTRSTNFPLSRFPYDSTLATQPVGTAEDAFLLIWSLQTRPNLLAPQTIITDTLLCETVVTDSFYVYNLGDTALNVYASLFDQSDPRFELVEPNQLTNRNLAPGDSLRYVVRISNTGIGTISNKLLVYSTDSLLGQSPDTIDIQNTRNAPAIDASSPIQFGSINLCRDSILEFNLINSGRGDVTVPRPTFALPGSPFSLADPSAFPIVIPERGLRKIRLRFAPTQAVQYTDTLLLPIAECDQRILRLVLLGKGESTILSGLPANIQFRELSACETTIDTTITITNSGTSSLQLRSGTVAGAGFQIVQPASFPDTIAPGGSRSLLLRFTPQTNGNSSGTLTIRTGPCDSIRIVQLSGSINGQPFPFPDRDTVDFGLLTSCSGSELFQERSLTLTNNATLPVSLTLPNFSGPFSHCLVGFPTEIDPQSSVSICLRYSPLLAGGDTVLLKIPFTIGGCRDTIEVLLTGAHVVPETDLEYDTINLGQINACVSTIDTFIVLNNRSDVDVTLDSIRGLNGIGRNNGPATIVLSAHQHIEIPVQIAPTTSGPFSEVFRLYTSPCNDSLDVVVEGQIEGALVTAGRNSITFAPIASCDTGRIEIDSLLLTLSGATGEVVSIASVGLKHGSLEGGPFGIIDSAGLIGRSITASPGLSLRVSFSSLAAGSYVDTLLLIFAPCLDTLQVPLAAMVVEPIINITQGAFGNVESGTSSSKFLVISNNSEIEVELDLLSEPDAPFTIPGLSDSLPRRLRPGDYMLLPAEFAPLFEANFTDSLVLSLSGGCVGRKSVLFTGSGTRTAEEIEFCVSGLYTSPGRVGDTATIEVRASRPLQISPPVDLDFYVHLDPTRFDFVDVENGTLEEYDVGTGLLRITTNGIQSIPEDLPVLQLRLLAGDAPFATLRLDSVVVVGGRGLAPARCDTVAVVSIINGCIVTGVRLGKYPNRLDRPVPNPVRSEVEITFQQLESARTDMRIFDVSGREVLHPLQAFLEGGEYRVRIDVRSLPSGTYYLMVSAGTWRETQRVEVEQ